MQTKASRHVEHFPSLQELSPEVLGTQFLFQFEDFPELDWLNTYFIRLVTLCQEREQLRQEIRAIEREGEVYRDEWIEDYSKKKNGKTYTYKQLRWLVEGRKKSGQPKVKTKHLPSELVGQVGAAIARGTRIKELERRREEIDQDMTRLKQIVRGTGRRLQRVKLQNAETHSQ